MSHQKIMRLFAKWHIWLGWLVGFPLVMWTVTGLLMVWYPIDEVRGTHLRSEIPALVPQDVVLPPLDTAIQSATLQNFADGPGWIVVEADGGRYRYSADEGRLLPPALEEDARLIAEATYAGPAALESVTYFPADANPLDLRAGANAWQAHFADGTNIYIHAQTGEVLAVRSQWWRTFDFMFGLHVMDLETREPTGHPTLLIFSALAVLGCVLGTVLMFRRRKAKVRVHTRMKA